MNFRVQKTYNFDTLAPAILGVKFKNAVMLGELSYELASARENIDLKYRQIYPVLPHGTPDSPKKQRYFIFRTESGPTVTLCDQWVNADTIEEVTGVNFEVKFTQALPEDINRIRDLISAAGYTNFTIS